jgi:hypothetical protein
MYSQRILSVHRCLKNSLYHHMRTYYVTYQYLIQATVVQGIYSYHRSRSPGECKSHVTAEAPPAHSGLHPSHHLVQHAHLLLPRQYSTGPRCPRHVRCHADWRPVSRDCAVGEYLATSVKSGNGNEQRQRRGHSWRSFSTNERLWAGESYCQLQCQAPPSHA